MDNNNVLLLPHYRRELDISADCSDLYTTGSQVKHYITEPNSSLKPATALSDNS